MENAFNTSELGDAPDTTDPLKAEWRIHFKRATCSDAALQDVNVAVREPIVGDWFKQGDLGYIYGPRGLGKTWLAMLLARKCVEGGMLASWDVLKPRRVLYVDGEMALDSIRQRNNALSQGQADGMYFLQHENLFHTTGKVLNLTAPSAQAALLEQCLEDKIEILLLDNLSCLFSGMNENDADAWEQVLPWLLDLRRNKIAVVFVAHAGRNGCMRGTSRREDAALWIISLRECSAVDEPREGARFSAEFVKNRNTTDAECPPMEWHIYLPPGETQAKVSWKRLEISEIFRQCIEDGLVSATAIAEELKISQGQVSKMAKKAIIAGWLTKDGRDYALTGKGRRDEEEPES